MRVKGDFTDFYNWYTTTTTATGYINTDTTTASGDITWTYDLRGMPIDWRGIKGEQMQIDGDKYLVIDVDSNCWSSEHKTLSAAKKAAIKAVSSTDHEHIIYKPMVSVSPKKETVTEIIKLS